MSEFSHLDSRGHARMVDVADRAASVRTAVVTGRVLTEVADRIADGGIAKGDVVATARIAGIMAAKKTPDLIPMCHPIAVHGVVVDIALEPQAVTVRAEVRTADRTGVEMEAFTAVSVACLTIIDMIKSADPRAFITDIRLEHKSGGRNGEFTR